MRPGRWIPIGAILVLAMPLAQAQVGFDRPGGDYANMVVPSGDPDVCSASCDRDPRCKAWSFSYPGGSDPRAVCWLKGKVPRPVPNPCCTSSVKGAEAAEPLTRAFEFSVDRSGGDYRNFETAPGPTGEACQQACKADPRCRSWTYARPGYEGPAARCFLKDRIKPPRRKPCCISGVVR
jgi:hypothetical protein